MVDHDQNGIVAVGGGKVSNQIHGDLLEGAGAFEGDRGKGRYGRVSVGFVGLASSAASNEVVDKGGYAGPPVILLEKRGGMEVSTMGLH